MRAVPSGPLLRCEQASQTRPEPSTATAGRSSLRKLAPEEGSSKVLEAGKVYAVPVKKEFPPLVECAYWMESGWFGFCGSLICRQKTYTAPVPGSTAETVP